MTDFETNMRKWIDTAKIEDLLRKWRCTPVGDPTFQGDLGDYYSAAMVKKRDEDPAAYTAASKRIGW